MSAPTDERPKLRIVTENYWPEVTSTGQLMTELAESLVCAFDVEILTTQPRFNGEYERRPRRERRNGVLIRRLFATAFAKSSNLGRLANWLTFLASLTYFVLSRGKATYLIVTNPPTAPWVIPLVALKGGRAFAVIYDLYPDLAEAIGAVRRGSFTSIVFDSINRFSLRRSAAVVALGEDMRSVLETKLGKGVRIEVIPNWANGEVITPRPKQLSRFAREHNLENRFVFLYAGNLGLFQNLETLAECVHGLDECGNPALVFVGDGGKRKLVESFAESSDRVFVFDFVPYEDLADLYACADVGLIALEPGVEKANVPSKTYSILAAGKPFIAVASASTDLRKLAEQGAGLVVANDASQVADAMRALVEQAQLRSSMGQKARETFEEHYTRERIVGSYAALLSQASKATVGR